MYPSNLSIEQGAKILWEGTIREVVFSLSYVLGVDDDWGDAEERGKAITAQMVQDWLDEMAAQGRIESIDPLTFVQTFENGMHDRAYSHAPDLVLAEEAPPRKQQYPQDCLVHRAVPLTFDATASQERAVRILRAYEEPYTFVHQPNGNWSCMSKDKVYSLFVDTQKHLGYCSCQDFQQRGMRTGMPCKHIYGYLLQDGRIKQTIKEV